MKQTGVSCLPPSWALEQTRIGRRMTLRAACRRARIEREQDEAERERFGMLLAWIGALVTIVAVFILYDQGVI